MTRYSKIALGMLGLAVGLILVGVVEPMAHATATIGGMSVLGIGIIVLLLMALGIMVGGGLKKRTG